MKISQHPAATAELEEAVVWYAERNFMAAEGFLQRIAEAKTHLTTFPKAATRLGNNLYRIVLHGYPYDLVYHFKDQNIRVLAYAHHSRRPGYWKSRLTHPH